MNTLFQIFYAPGAVFAGIPEKSRWYLPFVSTLILSCLASALIVNSIGMENLVRRQLLSQPRLVEQLGEEKIREIARRANSPARQVSALVSSVLGAGVIILVVAAILTALLALTGAGAGFRNVFSVTAYGLSKVSGRITFAHSAALVVGVWAVYVVAKTGISSLF